MNAVKIQVYCALIAYCMVAIVANILKVERPIYEILQILGISLLDKTSVNEMLAEYNYKNVKELNYKQLKITWEQLPSNEKKHLCCNQLSHTFLI
jgi:hypothetical protein